MGFLAGKRILVLGVASKLSIATGIAEALHREGAQLALTYQNDKLKQRVINFAETWGSTLVYPCDVTKDTEIEGVFSGLSDTWDGLDGIVHCLAFAPGNELD
ncbi:MAG: SDR family oxidoreductase, partial [Gammaproteobacteria bacterium]